MDRILLVVQGEDDLSGMLEVFNGGAIWEDSVPHEYGKVHEGAELDCSTVAGVLGVFALSEAEVESQGD